MFTIKEGTTPEKIGEGTDENTQKAIVGWLEKGGHVIRTTQQDQEYLKNKTQSEIDKVLGERNTQIEQTVQKLTGLNKNQGEKFYEYMERAVTEKLGQVSVLEGKIKEMETKGVDGSQLAQQYKKEVEVLQGQIKSLNEEWTGKVSAKDTEFFSFKVSNDIDRIINKFRTKFRQDLDPAIVEDTILGKLTKFNQENRPKSLEGMLVWTEPNGNTRNSKSDGKPMTTEELLLPYFETMFDKNQKKGGAGSGESGGGGAGNGGGGDSPKWKEFTLPSTVTTKVQLYEWLKKEKGMKDDTKDFGEAYEALGKNLRIR